MLVGFTDSDWAGDLDDRKSTAGYIFTLGSRPITWYCKKQSAISISSAEAEYRGFVRSYLNLVFISIIQLHFGVIIRVPFIYANIQFNINTGNTLSYTYTSSKISFMIVFLKCTIVQPMIKLLISLQSLSQKRSLPNFDLCLEFRKVIIKGWIGSNASFLILLCHLCKSFNPIPSCS